MGIQVNFIWLGSGELRPLDKFNVYSWRALGHVVTIYAFHFNGSHNLESLGLIKGAASVVNLPELIALDDKRAAPDYVEDVGYKKIIDATCRIRSVLATWYRAVDPSTKCTIEHIYNMADITKSYIAGTRIGIVLDLKIGPSEHVGLCEKAGVFDNYFVSYVRGSSTTPGAPENQCMGTMEVKADTRYIYADRFDKGLSAFNGHLERAKKPNDTHFNWLTGLHAKGWAALEKKRKALDVTNATKMGTLGLLGLTVKEIEDEVSFGPFRVFKRKADQTNTSIASTSIAEQVALCEHTCLLQERLNLVVNDVFHKERVRIGVTLKSSVYFS